MSDLNLENIGKSYGLQQVLNDINLSVKSGEFVVFVGPSGCGKSTLLRMISGLESISSGLLKIDGEVVNHIDAAKRGCAMVFQSYALYPHMTVFQNMAFSMTMAGTPKKEKRERVERVARILQLENLLDRKPGQLSGGQNQRVAIGRAIVREPKIFLLDEPLSNLDAELRVQMRTELIELHRQLRATMIFVTHDQVEAMTLADKMVVMHGGRIQQVGPPLTLYDDPENKFVASFIGTPRMNFIPAKVTAVSNAWITVELPSEMGSGAFEIPFAGFDGANREIQIGIRPEHVTLVDEPSEGSVPVTIKLAEELGDISYVHTECSEGTSVSVQVYGSRFRKRNQAWAALNKEKLFLFEVDGERIRGTAQVESLSESAG